MVDGRPISVQYGGKASMHSTDNLLTVWLTVIFEAAAQGSPEEEDLFLARALLQTLLIGPAGRSAAAVEARRERVRCYTLV